MWRARLVLAIGLVTAAVLVAACGGGGGGKLTPNASTTGTTTTASGNFLGKGDGEDASAGSVPDYQPTGELVADNGFRPTKNGFPFENYGNDGNPQNLTPADVQQLFGDQVCSSGSGESCQLTPPAQQWMDESNKSMAGGHCEGFSVTALRMYKGVLKADSFGANDPFGLQNVANLQSEIAKGFVTQDFQSVRAAQVKGSPNQILDKLIEILKSKGEYYTVGIYRSDGQGGRTGGHAVTPYAVEDKGGGKMNLLIYDNNYPGKTRVIEFDRNVDSWSYTAQTNPSDPAQEYKGDAQTNTIELDPETPSEGQQPCPFCQGEHAAAGNKGSTGSVLPSNERYNEINLESDPVNHSHLVLTDDQGHKLGYENGKFVQDIPGATVVWTTADRDWESSPEPSYRVPAGTKVTVTIDGSNLKQPDTENLTMVGPGLEGSVDDMKMAPGQKDEVTLNGDGSGVKLKTDPGQTESPSVAIGFSANGPDYGFAIAPTDLAGGSAFGLNLDQQAGKLTIDTSGTQGSGTYAVAVVRGSSTGTEKFKHDNLKLDSGEMASLNYSAFTKPGDSIKLDISGNGQSRVEELTPDQG
jgi:hypothetical protein